MCLRVSKTSLTPKYLFIASILSNIAEIQRILNRYDLFLVYELKYFSIRERILPSDHQDIGKNVYPRLVNVINNLINSK